jgi:hypothetical protein
MRESGLGKVPCPACCKTRRPFSTVLPYVCFISFLIWASETCLPGALLAELPISLSVGRQPQLGIITAFRVYGRLRGNTPSPDSLRGQKAS